MKTLSLLLEENKELFWDVADNSQLDPLVVQERFFQYGDWENIQDIKVLYGQDTMRNNYLALRNKKRSSLSKRTVHFFDLYFHV